MTMNEKIILALAFFAGGGLGAVFFVGLWWTVRKAISSQRPALLFVVSLIVRMGLVLVGFYYVSGGHWERLAACFFGFFVVRMGVTLWSRSKQEPIHAP